MITLRKVFENLHTAVDVITSKSIQMVMQEKNLGMKFEGKVIWESF